jgi:glycosyltransferase involved in cell wall biosynthesis
MIVSKVCSVRSARLSISIAMATYNGARYIRDQLESLSKQTVLPDELVVSDDASSDETLSIVADFAARAPFRVRMERNSHRLGYRANFMRVADLSNSDLIAFCDQDDIWLPTKLATCLGMFKNKEVLLTYHNGLIVTETLEPIGSLKDRGASRAFNGPQSISPWQHALGFTMVLRRALLDFADCWPESSHFFSIDNPEAHDQWFYFLASSLGTIAYVKEPLALYRQHGDNAYGWNDEPSFRRTMGIIRMPSAEGLNARAITAGKRAAILDKIQTKSAEYHDRAGSAALGYRKLKRNLRRRQEIYLSDTTLSKLTRLAFVIASGVYRSQRRWGVGLQAMISDMLHVIRP